MDTRYDTMRAAVAARLSPGAAGHSERVAQTAAALAERYGVDIDDARVAGLLHDWCKDVPGEELIRLAEEYGISVTGVDRAVPYLLHGAVAAAVLPADFPWLTPGIIAAIESHTYGCAGIDDLGMIVYIADTIEPGRSHRSADALREAVGALSLPELFERTYAESVSHLVDGRRPIHPSTVETWNSLVAGDR